MAAIDGLHARNVRQRTTILVLCVVALILPALEYIGILPESTTMVTWINSAYSSHGLVIVFLAAMLEGLFFLSLYFPGSLLILLGPATSGHDSVAFLQIYFSGLLGLSISYVIDYLIGRSRYRNSQSNSTPHPELSDQIRTAKKYQEYFALFLAGIHPHSGALAALASGLFGRAPANSLLIIIAASAFWGLFWGILARQLGPRLLALPFWHVASIVSIIVLVTTLLIRTSRAKRATTRVANDNGDHV